MTPPLKYQIMPGCPISAPIKPPVYEGDVGYDLAAAIRDGHMVLEPHEFTDVPTYVRVELPVGYWGDLRTRSSTFAKRRLLVMPGTIDNGYRGMLSILLFNPNPHPVVIHQGDYLAQIVLQPTITPELVEVAAVSESQRGDKGFGSSGGFKSPPPQDAVVVPVEPYDSVECTCGTGTAECPVGKRVGNHPIGSIADGLTLRTMRTGNSLEDDEKRARAWAERTGREPWGDRGWESK